MFAFIPLLIGIGLSGVLLLPLFSDRAEIVLDGIGQALLSETVDTSQRRHDQLPKMEAAHVPRSHRSFSSQTVLYSILAGVATGCMSLTIVWELLSLLGGMTDSADIVARTDAIGLFELWPRAGITVVLSGIAAVAVGVLANWLWWVILGQQSYARGSQIDATLPRTVAFMYALSRSGMAFSQVLRTLGDNRRVYGEAAAEVNATVQQMDLFGVDLQTAIEDMGDRTPSENMAELSENLDSVLGSGRSLSSYLRSQYERYKEEAEAQQEQYLELLATLAEAYVTVLVAGPLFVITTLAVIGLVLQDTLPVIRVMTYVGIPLATFAFIVYVDSVTESAGTQGQAEQETETVGSTTQGPTATDGGVTADRWRLQREMLDTYDKLDRILTWLTQPWEMLLRRPTLTFGITAPFGLGWVVVSIDGLERDLFGLLEALVPPLTEAAIVMFGIYSIVYEIQKRRARSIEKAIPDFLDRLASVNDAGMSIVESFRRVKDSDLGGLNPELERAWKDIQWGADVATALQRMDRRVRSPVVTRAVTLSTNAMETSDDIAPVLEIAADEARSTHVLNRQRKQTMLTYLVVIYVSFFVFLGIMAALMVSFIPAIEDVMTQMAESTSGSSGAAPGRGLGMVGSSGDINISGYETIFFHVTLIQSACSGLVAGQLGQNSVKDGVKHVTIMLLITYILFIFL